jgi:nucleotide-binding universal stress UspA family protein
MAWSGSDLPGDQMHHILAATDLSPRSDPAVERAFRLADRLGARLTVFTAVDDAMPARLARVMLTETEGHLTAFCERLSDGGRIGFETRVTQGDPVELVPDTVVAAGADLLVLGLHRRRAYLEGLRETTLERALRIAGVPVLLVRNGARTDYRTVLAAVDFSPAATAAIRVAHALAPDAAIRGVHAVEPSIAVALTGATRDATLADAQAACDRWMDQTPLPALSRPEIRQGELSPVFLAEFGRLTPDLVALGAHARMGLVHRRLGSFAQELLGDPPADVLFALPEGWPED